MHWCAVCVVRQALAQGVSEQFGCTAMSETSSNNNISNSCNWTTPPISAKIVVIVLAILDSWMSPRDPPFLTMVVRFQFGVVFWACSFDSCFFQLQLITHFFKKDITTWFPHHSKMTQHRRLVDAWKYGFRFREVRIFRESGSQKRCNHKTSTNVRKNVPLFNKKCKYCKKWLPQGAPNGGFLLTKIVSKCIRRLRKYCRRVPKML